MSDTPELDEIREILAEYEGSEGSDRYGRLESLARISVLLDSLARKDGFGPGAVAAYSRILS